jgi:hypothetical protein
LTVVVTTYPRIVNRRAYAAALLVGGALVAQAGLASPARAATVRYAAPGGSGTACTAAAPCAIDRAVNFAATGDEVVINPGTYSVTTGLSSSVSSLNIHGVAGQPRPVINSSAATALNLTGAGPTLSDLTINHTGSTWGINVFASSGTITVQRLEVHSAGFATCEIGIAGTVRDTLCVNAGADGVALEDSWGSGNGTLRLRNVTAVATGTGSYGVRAETLGNNSTLTVNATNVIASGVAADVRVVRGGTNSVSATVVMAYSNYDTTSVATGGTVTAAGSGTNQTAAPVFLETTTYRQAASSPTVNKGATTPESGTADLDGDPRVTGPAPDIGVDEFDVTPPDTVFTHTPKAKTHKRSARFAFAATEAGTFTCQLDKKPPTACASPFTVKLGRKKYGKHQLTVVSRDAVGNTDPTPATFVWKYKHKRHKKHHHHHRH